MQEPGEEFLPTSGFAGNQDNRGALRHAIHHAEKFACLFTGKNKCFALNLQFLPTTGCE